jgi:transposase-like protein
MALPRVADSLAGRLEVLSLIHGGEEGVLADRTCPKDHWLKIWSTKLLERANEKNRRRTLMSSFYLNNAAIIWLVGAVLLAHHEH